MTTTHTRGGQAVLAIAHVVGLVDLVALPIWIGALVQHYGYNAQQAGLTVTLFLVGVAAASLLVSPRFNALPRRPLAAAGFALAAVAFFVASRQPLSPASFGTLGLLHALAGVGVGTALSFTHGCIGRSANPHRLFAVAAVLLGVFAVLFLGGVPVLIRQYGATVFFGICAGLMAFGAVVVALGFPALAADADSAIAAASGGSPKAMRVPAAAWYVAGAVVCLTLNQAMVFAFVERIGVDHGFGAERVNAVLIALGLVNLTPGVLAAVLQKRLSAVTVGLLGPIGQALLALTIVNADSFAPYAFATSVYVFMVIFTHAFLFGLLARIDPSGRATSATPAMMMIGSCIGPALGGALVHGVGYPAVGVAACVVSLIAVCALARVRRQLAPDRASAVQPVVQGSAT